MQVAGEAKEEVLKCKEKAQEAELGMPLRLLPFFHSVCVRACVRVGISVARARAHLGCAGKSLWSVWRWCHGSFQRPVPRLEEH